MKRKIYNPRHLKTGPMAFMLAGLLGLNAAKAQKLEKPAEAGKQIPGLQFSFYEIGNLKFRLEVTKPLLALQDPIDVFIVSDDRQILYARTYSPRDLRITTFDLSTLQDGTYGFEVRSGTTRIAQRFDIKTQSKRVILDRN